VIGTAILGANYAVDGGGESDTYSASSTFDFADRGNLKLGLIDNQENGFAGGLGFQSMEFTIIANGVEILDSTFRSLAVAESFFRDNVINLGSDFGPDIDLTFGYTLVAEGSGGFGFDFALGGANLQPVPEVSTWAMMLVGLAGLGLMSRRGSRKITAVRRKMRDATPLCPSRDRQVRSSIKRSAALSGVPQFTLKSTIVAARSAGGPAAR
jgi:hypothetical protein